MKKEWIVVASNEEVRIFKRVGASDIELLRDIGNPLGTAREQDLITDKPGRATDNRMRARHSYSTEQSHRERVLIEFFRDIIDILDKSFMSHDFDNLTIIAEPRLLGIIRQLLPERIKRAVRREIRKDLSFAEAHRIAQETRVGL
jgi:protein required for attachment to host cells